MIELNVDGGILEEENIIESIFQKWVKNKLRLYMH